MTIEKWYITISVAASLGQTLFVLLYLFFPWHETFLGKALFVKALTLSLLLNTALAGAIWDWDQEPIWIVSMYGLAMVGIWAQLTAFAVQRFGSGDQDSTLKKRDYHHGT